MKRIIIGTRGSPLALAQVDLVSAFLRKAHPGIELDRQIIKTSGDKFLDVALSAVGGKGVFTKEIEDQLLAGQIDLAVHSLKDLPTELPAGLTIAAVLPREDARDAFISKRYKSVDELPQGARVATGSVRRKAQLLARRPDLKIEEIRGNVGTRLSKLAEFDAIILAVAGMKRLGLEVDYHPLDVSIMIPAVGQGIVAIEVRESDLETQEILAAINHADTLACAEAERVFLKSMGGGCQLPYAGHATITGDQLRLIGAQFEPTICRTDVTGAKSDPHELGTRAARAIRG
ncbi:MAG: hydroxymethylbilane synthase [Verrucomicrobiota bacterium]